MKCDELEYRFLGDCFMYDADEVDAAIAELKAENERLKAIRKVHVEAIASMGAGLHQDDKEIRRLKRALWLARAKRAVTKQAYYDVLSLGISSERSEMYDVWNNVEHKCREKAEEYK